MKSVAEIERKRESIERPQLTNMSSLLDMDTGVFQVENTDISSSVLKANKLQFVRSEERRVGEEGRSRWSPCH